MDFYALFIVGGSFGQGISCTKKYVSVNKIKFESNRINELILLIVSTHVPVYTNLMAIVYPFTFPVYS